MNKGKWNRPLGAAVSFALTCSLVFGMSVSSVDSSQAASKKPKLSSKSISVMVGKVKKLQVKQTSQKVKWSVKKGAKCITLTNKKKTSVSIKGKKAGTATVQAAVAGQKLTCKVKVLPGATVCPPPQQPTASATPTAASQNTVSPSGTPTAVPTVVPTEVPTASPSAAPTEEPTPTPLPEGVYEGTDISWIDPEKPMVAFTFDDGPIGNEETDNSMMIHKALKEHGAHATFFYIGSRAANNDKAKDEIKRAAEAGFEVGNHSYDWSSLSNMSQEKIEDSIGKTNDILTEMTGYHNFLFRAPNLATSTTMRECINAPFVHCGVDSKDWDGATTEKIIENVKKAKDGDIILMHETQDNTVEAVPELLDYFQEQGWQVVSVSELFLARGKTMTAGQDHYNCPPEK